MQQETLNKIFDINTDKKYLKLLLVPFLFIIIEVVIVLYTDFFMFKKIISQNIALYKEDYILMQKSEAKMRVNYIIKYIENLKKNFPSLTKKDLQKLAIEWIRENQHKYKYIFVYKLLNKNGGDKFAIMLINPNRKDLEGKYLSTNYKDIKGNKFREIMLKNVLKNGETFVTYYYKKPGSNKFCKKISFFKYYKDFNWIIATGIYFDVPNDIINKFKYKIFNELKENFLKLIVFIVVLTVISIIILFILFRKISISMYIKNKMIIQQSEKLKKEAIEREKYIKRLQNDYIKIKELEEKNEELINSLEKKVNEQVKEIRKKENLLMQQSKLAAMGEMIANIAHQWRQPLNLLSGILIEISMNKEMDKLTKTDIENCINEAQNIIDNMSKTIDNFQNFFSQKREKSTFYIFEIVDEIQKILKTLLISKNISLIINKNCKNLKINGFRNDLKQVFLVIINNAIDAIIAKKMKSGLIMVECENSDEFEIIKIKDNAGGIPEKIIDRIFEPYFTTKHKSQGTGIGLFMAMEIISKHFNGELMVQNVQFKYDNKIEKGAEFIIKIPK